MKRVYKTAGVLDGEDGFTVALDGRPLRSPGKRPLTLPTRPLAEAVAAEWDAQGEEVDAKSMVMMGFAATVADRVTPQRDHVVGEIAGYGGSDLLCFLADGPEELIARQTARWTPWRTRVEDRLGIRLATTAGIMPVRQPEAMLRAFRDAVGRLDDWHLAPLHTFTTITGSLILALAAIEGGLAAEEAFDISQIDETFQTEQWGQDREAEERRRNLRAEMLAAERFKGLLNPET